MIFQQISKRETCFPNGQDGLQKRNVKNIVCQQNKDKDFKPADNRSIINLIQSTINVNVQMKRVFRFSLMVLNKNDWLFYYY